MTINSRQNPSDRSSFRLSLLMRMLIAEGPGTVIWKRYAGECVYDRSSHDLLRRELTSYSFMACPNAHFINEQKDDINALVEMLETTTEKNDDQDKKSKLAQFFAKLNVPSVRHIRSFKEMMKLPENKNQTYHDRIREDYFVSQSGPIVICGSPPGFWGYRRQFDRQAVNDRSELEILLDDCGYSNEFDIALASDGIEKSSLHYPSASPYGLLIAEGFIDLGLIYVGRTSRKQLVVVFAGVTHAYGTYGAIRMGMDAGRNEINFGLLAFLKGTSRKFSLVGNVRPWIESAESPATQQTWEREADIFRSSTPVDASIEYPREISEFSIFDLDEWDKKLETREPEKLEIKRVSTKLGEYFSTEGPISAMVKAYPNQIQEDANAKDLLEWLLPDTHFIPALGNAPHDIEFRSYLCSEFNEDLTPKNEGDKTFMLLMNKVDSSGADLIRSWVSISKQLATNQEQPNPNTLSPIDSCVLQTPTKASYFRTYFLNQYRLDSNPLIILGSLESYAGFLDPTYSQMPEQSKSRSQLAELVDSIKYPNRYQLVWENGGGTIVDKKTMKRFKTINFLENATEDYGIVYLCRDKSGRIVLVVAGLTSRGTEAGLQLILEERRADIDAAVQSFLDGKQKALEIAFRSWKGISRWRHEVTPLTADLQTTFIANSNSRHILFQLDKCFEQKNQNTTKTLPLDKFNSWTILSSSSTREITINSTAWGTSAIQFRSAASEKFQHKIELIAEHIRKRQHTRVLVLGETGSGKEGAALAIHQLSRPDKPYQTFNLAAFSPTLVESQLFGHAEGAFNDAKVKVGAVELSQFGTLLLDELTLDSKEFQDKLIRFLQSGEFYRVGEETMRRQVECTVVLSTNFATNREEFEKKMEVHGQRIDISGRCQFDIAIPPLRERPLEKSSSIHCEVLSGDR